MNWTELSKHYLVLLCQTGKFIVGAEKFLSSETTQMYYEIVNFANKYSIMPNMEYLHTSFNIHYQHYQPNTPIEQLADELKKIRIHNLAEQTIVHIQKYMTTTNNAEDYLNVISDFQNQLFESSDNIAISLQQYQEVIQYYSTQTNTDYVCSYGFPSLDNYTGGIRQGQFIVLYANTSQGKSTIARKFAGNIAEQGYKVLYITLEESSRKSVIKTLSTMAECNSNRIIDSVQAHHDISKIYDKMQNVSGNVFFIDNVDHKNVTTLAKYSHIYHPTVIILDQIPLFTPGGSRSNSVLFYSN